MTTSLTRLPAGHARHTGRPDRETERWFYTPVEVAARTGLSASEVRAAIYAGRLHGKKYGSRRWLIPAEEVTRWLESELTEPA